MNAKTMLHPLLTALSNTFIQTRQANLELGHCLLITWAEAKDGIGVPEFVNLKVGVTTSYEILYAELRSNGVDT